MVDGQGGSDVVRYLNDVGEEYSPARFGSYASSVRPYVPEAACADLDAAFEAIAVARLCVDRAVRRVQALDR
jgi:hypothetical protein